MNVFKILASCNGNISETNISAMLVYLLNPSNDHGLGDKFLEKIVGKLKNEELKNNKKLQSYLINSSGYRIEIIDEFPVDVGGTDSDKSTRYIDIVIEFYNEESKDIPEFAIAIENKIRQDSISDINQISDEIAGLKENYGDDENVELHCILICPQNDKKVEKSLCKISGYNNTCILWKEGDDSIIEILNEILNEEAQGAIDPLSTETKYIVKSFIAFVINDFKSKEQSPREKKIKEYLFDIYTKLVPNKEYTVKEIRKKLSDKAGEIDASTRNCQIYKVTVNAPSRVHIGINKPFDDQFNLFYYSDSSGKNIKKFDKNSNEDITIYWKGKDGKRSETLSKLREMEQAGKI
jgi:hypothetical protein